MILMQEETLQEPSFSRRITDMHLNRCLDPLRASIWHRFGYQKSIQNPSGSDLGWHHISDLEFKGWHRSARRPLSTRDPGTWDLVMYILESRARCARAQFSRISIWRPSPSLKGLGLHPEPEPRYSVMSARNLFLGAFGRATSC